ncbi:isopentenyl-diphosphate Delta-isomerase [Fulvivirga lutea]|uniref:Isopentenyl-diphosphate delta-isomerase n=1 Tax=Fulvivirga lutea TaxID=2810512 RepID=A0A974WE34_9BACT|nr:isopentenyl-diphosphate Delta-isomerase [Fulvivirga lutea]QSE96045.1 isopentenyl-diphosphate Delta-isomerase [Fulvivirga lutea]
MEEVVLVNPKDDEVGTMEKMEAHLNGVLHRAFSVLVYNSEGQMLLQKRAQSKYHSGGLWTNACCSHPKPGEDNAAAAKRRLIEELGINADPEYLYKFIYKAKLDNNLTEHEYDHVFTCITDQQPHLNKAEAEDYKYVDMKELFENIDANPDEYTFWFRMIAENLKNRSEIPAN